MYYKFEGSFHGAFHPFCRMNTNTCDVFHIQGECQVRKSRNFVYSLQLISHRFLILIGFDLYMHFDRILDKKLFKVWYSVPAKFRAIHTFTGSGQSVVGLTMPVGPVL